LRNNNTAINLKRSLQVTVVGVFPHVTTDQGSHCGIVRPRSAFFWSTWVSV